MHRTVDALRELRHRPRRLLAVFAHPDDEAYGCAGALARAGRDPETATVLLTLTSGEASTVLAAEGKTRDAIRSMREERMVAVAERLALDGLLLPRLPDGALATTALPHLGDTVREAILAFEPQVVIGPDPRGVNAHPDHIAAHWAVRRGLEGTARRRFAMLVYLQDMADAVHPRLLFATPARDVDVVVEMDEADIEAKEDCLRIHDALVTLKEGGHGDLLVRPPIERFDLLEEAFDPPLGGLFERLD